MAAPGRNLGNVFLPGVLVNEDFVEPDATGALPPQVTSKWRIHENRCYRRDRYDRIRSGKAV